MPISRAPLPIWNQFSIWLGSPLAAPVLLGLAALAVFGMLLAFHQVMDGAVRQGDARRQADALQAQASLRCPGLSSLKTGMPACTRLAP